MPVDLSRLIKLEATDKSLIYDIGDMAVFDDKYIIRSRSLIRAFDRNGKFLYSVSKIGQGPGEYLGVQQFWNEQDTLCVLDFNSGCVWRYLNDGTFIDKYVDFKTITAPFFSSPNYLVKLPDGNGFITINSYTGGSAEHNPKHSILSGRKEFVSHVPNRELTDGSFTPDRMITDYDNDRILSWEQLRDTLFTVDSHGVLPLYVFDFGKNKFPEEYQSLPEFYQRVEKFNEHKEGTPYASLIKYYQPIGDNLYFSFITTENTAFLVRYNEKEDKISLIHLLDTQERFRQNVFFKIANDSIFVSMNNTQRIEDNPYLITFPLQIFD